MEGPDHTKFDFPRCGPHQRLPEELAKVSHLDREGGFDPYLPICNVHTE